MVHGLIDRTLPFIRQCLVRLLVFWGLRTTQEPWHSKQVGQDATVSGLLFSATTGSGTETFTDNYDGTLTSNAGGTGTINYATGAYDITFNEVTTGAVTSGYQWENATIKGVADFSKSATRVAGEGSSSLKMGGRPYFKRSYWAGRVLLLS